MIRSLLAFAFFLGALAPFVAANAQSDLCADPQRACGQRVQSSCLTRFGAGSVAAAPAECGDQLESYTECLRQVATECGGRGAGGDVGLLRRTPNMGVSFEQAGETVLIRPMKVGEFEAYAPLLQPGAFVMRVPKVALTKTQWDYYALVVHAARTDDLFRVPLAHRCWLCENDRIWPTGGSGMADTTFGSGQLFLTRYYDPRKYDELTGFNYLAEPRIEDKGSYLEVYVSSLIDLDEDAEYLKPGATVYLTLVDGDMIDTGKGKLDMSDFERVVLRF